MARGFHVAELRAVWYNALEFFCQYFPKLQIEMDNVEWNQENLLVVFDDIYKKLSGSNVYMDNFDCSISPSIGNEPAMVCGTQIICIKEPLSTTYAWEMYHEVDIDIERFADSIHMEKDDGNGHSEVRRIGAKLDLNMRMREFY